MGRHGQVVVVGRPTPHRAPTSYRRKTDEPYEFRHAAPKRRVRAPRWSRLCVTLGVFFLLVSSTAYGAELFLTQRYEKNINREDLLGSNRSAAARAKKVKGPLTFLILGLDKRSKEDFDPNDESSNTWTTPDEGRADTIMVVHVPAGMDSSYVVSIPRDADVDIPAQGKYEGGRDKINAAYFYGGAPLMVATVNKLLGVKVDYPIIVNFKAVREITDALDGVDVTIDVESYDPRTKRTWKPGKHHLNGKEAEAYVRQRYGLDGSDYDRQKRQQQFIHALMDRIDKKKITTSPVKLDKLIRVITKNITVDKSMPVKELAFALKSLRPTSATYLTLPMAGSSLEDDVWYEYVDELKAQKLGKALKSGTLDKFISANPEIKNDPTHGR